MANPYEGHRGEFRSDTRRRFGGPGRWGEDEWRGDERDDFRSRTYVASGRDDERGFREDYGRGGREDYGGARFGSDSERGRFGRDYGEDYGRSGLGREDYGRGSFGREDSGRFGMGREDYGRSAFGREDYGYGSSERDEARRGAFGREDYGRGNFGRQDYGQGNFGNSRYGAGYGMGGYGTGGYDMDQARTYGRWYGQGSSAYGDTGRGSEFFRERWGRDAGERDERGPMDKLREGARRLMGKGPKNYRRSDDRIRDDLNERLMTSWMDAEEVEVLVKDGEVTLNGSVYTREEKRAIEDVAEDVLGVKEVHNHLRTNRGSGGLNPQPGSATREAGTPGGRMHS